MRSNHALEGPSDSVRGKNTFPNHSKVILLLVCPFCKKVTCQPGFCASPLPTPLLLDVLGLGDYKGVYSDSKRRTTRYYRGPSKGLYCLSRYGDWVLLQGACDKRISTLTSTTPPPSTLYQRQEGIRLTVLHRMNKCLIFSGVASFKRSQLTRQPKFDLTAKWRMSSPFLSRFLWSLYPLRTAIAMTRTYACVDA